jgi:hypothetical protein
LLAFDAGGGLERSAMWIGMLSSEYAQAFFSGGL